MAYLGNRRVSCEALDVGIGGVSVRCPLEAPPGTFVRLNLRFGVGSPWLDVDGIVVASSRSSEGHVMRVQFQALSRALLDQVREHLRRRQDPAPAQRSPSRATTLAPSPRERPRTAAQQELDTLFRAAVDEVQAGERKAAI